MYFFDLELRNFSQFEAYNRVLLLDGSGWYVIFCGDNKYSLGKSEQRVGSDVVIFQC